MSKTIQLYHGPLSVTVISIPRLAPHLNKMVKYDQQEYVITSIIKCYVKLLIHSVQLLKFGMDK